MLALYARVWRSVERISADCSKPLASASRAAAKASLVWPSRRQGANRALQVGVARVASSSQRQSDAASANGADRARRRRRASRSAAAASEAAATSDGVCARSLSAWKIAPALPGWRLPPSVRGPRNRRANLAAARRGQRRCGSAVLASIGSYAALTASKLGPSELMRCRARSFAPSSTPPLPRLVLILGPHREHRMDSVWTWREREPIERPAERGGEDDRTPFFCVKSSRESHLSSSLAEFLLFTATEPLSAPTALSTRWRPKPGRPPRPNFRLARSTRPSSRRRWRTTATAAARARRRSWCRRARRGRRRRSRASWRATSSCSTRCRSSFSCYSSA